MRWLRRLVRFLVGVVVAIFLVLGIVAALLAFSRDGRFFLAALFMQITSHHSPPPIAKGVISSGSDWMDLEPASSKFTAALLRRFPLGSDAGAMHDALQAQGFGDEAWLHETALCQQPDDDMSPTLRLVHCPPAPWRHSLHYAWGGAVCHQDLTVLWSTDARNHIAQIAGFYTATCF